MKGEKIIKRGKICLITSMAFAVGIILILFNSAFIYAAELNYCCEKTTSGAWCQNAPSSQCDSGFKKAPTSCDSTSFCKRGCCFDSQEGLCMESTPQRVCENAKTGSNETEAIAGTWSENAECNIPQCKLGCCVIGDQGAFVTLTRCKQLSGFYGLKIDFRGTISDELTCIATAQGADKGACVTEDSSTLAKKCVFTTREKCSVGKILGDVNVSSSENNAKNATINRTEVTEASKTKKAVASVGFYKDVLCSAEELGSICGPSTKTTLVEGKDEVYFLDTCGNIANIYDASRYKDKVYWKKVIKKKDSCGYGSSNAGSKDCGNCDYYLGSIGKRATFGTGNPTYGNYICVDLSCKTQGKKHGESWCVTDSPSGKGEDTAGSRYFKEVCLNNEILTEPCADFRNEICIQGSFSGFSEAACRINRWQDCVQQKEQDDCENGDQRDCLWVEDYYFSTATGQIEKVMWPEKGEDEDKDKKSWIDKTKDKISGTYDNTKDKVSDITNRAIDEEEDEDEEDDEDSEDEDEKDTSEMPLTPTGLCVPYYPPGFNFWGKTDEANKNAVVDEKGKSTGASTSTGTGKATGEISTQTPAINTQTPSLGTGTNAGTGASKGFGGLGTGAVDPSSGTSDTCSMANAKLTFRWQRVDHPAIIPFLEPLFGDTKRLGEWECANGTAGDSCREYVEDPSTGNITSSEVKKWAKDMNEICFKLGDCGGYTNWVGVYTSDGYAAYKDFRRVAGTGGAEILEQDKKTGTGTAGTGGTGNTPKNALVISGNVVKDFIKKMAGRGVNV